MLKITNLQKTFNPGTVNAKVALSGFDLTINEGDFVTVIGGNGAGKSTLLNAIAGVWKPDYGKIPGTSRSGDFLSVQCCSGRRTRVPR